MAASPDSDHPTDPVALFAGKTDAELLYLARYAAEYPAPVGQAAVRELQRRGLVPEVSELPAGPVRPPVSLPEPSAGSGLRRTVKGIFGFRNGYRAIPALLWLNLLGFLLLGLGGANLWQPAAADLIRWGSNFSPLTLPGQPWRLLTSTFLHGGVAHLVMNMASLVFLGLLTERLTGSRRLLWVYLVSGVGGSLASLWWHSQGVNSVGASGAIFGLYGLLLATLVRRPAVFSRSERYTVLLFVLYLMVGSLVGGLQAHTTDNAAHVGGLLTGAALGAVLPAPAPPSPPPAG
ncbi:rhomboid family intramembrane serine protease [Hymenobacter rubripertinctus]|uniref:Rhomboid family intramembrane serine protease n=1 Tax=Hymenobacter rubripertinctus TaxID=2029981 RepID=A0A418QSD5_9BACT|nr:rhomboid family intramembrane serine protease [Hymenobacter rubripertinctus]RIY08187.1 rhomboid family intramembrane serine protease [Hymenobacter rubripertinctus]